MMELNKEHFLLKKYKGMYGNDVNLGHRTQ